MSLGVAVFASGSGSNLQAILDHQAALEAPSWRVALVVSDREGVGALRRAEAAGVPGRVITVSGRPEDDVSSETLDAVRSAEVGFIGLAGYLRLVPAAVVSEFRRRIVNIHPALLPAFGGKGMYGPRVHEAVLESGARVSGPTVHFVDEQYDRGTIVAQWPVPVLREDTPESVAARVLSVEHVLYPRVVHHLCTALSQGREPARFASPGTAFVASLDESGEDLRRAIDDAFEGR